MATHDWTLSIYKIKIIESHKLVLRPKGEGVKYDVLRFGSNRAENILSH